MSFHKGLSKIKTMGTPRSIYLSITSKCNLFCNYCGHFTSAGDTEKDISTEEWLRYFKELNRYSVMNVTFSGGEPFFRKDLKELIKGIVKNRIRFNILSNGTLITDETAAFLASTKRCDFVQVSIDGSNSATHDSCRGKGNFLKAMLGIKHLQKHNISVTVRVTIHKYNVEDLDMIAWFLLEELGLPSFSTSAASFMGICRQNTKQVQLSIDEYSLAMDILVKLNNKYNGRIKAASGPLANAENWSLMHQALNEKEKSLPNSGYLKSCGGVFSKMAVRADGVMIPCNQMSHIELGQINKDDLKDVWQNHFEFVRLRERRAIPLNKFEFCHGCNYIPYCSGSCPALAYTILGKENHPSPDSCLKHFFEKGGKLPV